MDPYKVLGVSPGATQEEIKTVYRNLVKKYHPDKYADNPLGDLAEEKMQEINAAYDMLTGSGSQSSGGSYSRNQGSQGSTLDQVRQLINANRIQEALSALDSIGSHTAEWYYLRGVCMSRMGMYAQANTFYSTAYRMEPGNQEYARAANNMRNSNTTFYNQRSNMRGNDCSGCDICSSLICADCCCECMGGDLIGCC
ncbi:MAG: J domain-containing protein [Clostridia bacterium]|nr:J domain-containing protein [Clostridia bacterium]